MNIGKQRVTRTNKIGFLSLPVTGHLNPMTALARKLQYRLIRHPDRKTRELAAEAWCKREDGHVSLNPQAKPNARFADPDFRMMFATLVIHYWANAAFLGGQEILQNMGRIVHLPGVLIHGRLDVSSPLQTAWQLHQSWSKSRLIVVESEGHGGAAMANEFTKAIASFLPC